MSPAPIAIHRSMTLLEWALLVTLSVVWGGSYLFIAVAVQAVPPLTIVAVRVTLGAALLYLVVRATGRTMPTDPRIWLAFAAMGLLNNAVPFSLIAWGQSHLAAGLASILNATTPFFTVIVAHMLTRDERLSVGRLTGVVVGFLGVAVMMGVDLLDEVDDHFLAQVAVLLASAFYAFSAVYARRFARLGLAPMATATGQLTASAAIMLPVALLVDAPWLLPAPPPAVFASLAGLAALSTCFAYVIFYRILATAGAVNLMLVTFLIPVSAILLGAVVLGERLAPHHFLGMAAIGAGLAIIDGRPLAMLRRRRA